MNRRSSSLVANPVLIGAATVLLALVATVLSYNANSGLPFVRTYDLHAEVEDAKQLVTGNDVRIGGKRVGAVTAITPTSDRDGRPRARITLQLDLEVAELPADSRLRIRPRGVIGAKFVDLVPGRARRTLPSGATVPVAQTSAAVDLQELADVFDDATRRGVRRVTQELSDGLAGRGVGLNRTFADLPDTARRAEAVLAVLADPATDLAGFLRHGAALVDALRPVSGDLGGLVDRLATTLGAVDRSRQGLGDAIVRVPGTLEELGRASTRLRPVFDQARRLVRDVAPGVRRLPGALRATDGALREGTPLLRRTPALLGRVDAVVDGLDVVRRDRATTDALTLLEPVGREAVPLVRWLEPLQTRCNGVGLFFKGTTGITVDGDRYGNWYQMLPVLPVPPPLRVGAPDAEAHLQTYSDPGDGTCPVGNERYLPGQRIGALPGPHPTSNPRTPWTEDDR
ncbi:MAG: MlaD family protein [Solirubrobacteraceae bacterium]|nr:MlaD family protein [Solirubrobacteraceae bacterium]